MKSFNPIIALNIILVIFISICILIFIFLLKSDKLTVVSSIVIGAITLVLITVLASFNVKTYGSVEQFEKSEISKNRLYFYDGEFVIDSPLLQEKKIVEWKQVEAVFLMNSAPLDGEYFNFQYIIFAKTPVKTVRYKNQKWYNKILPAHTDRAEVTIIRIDDYRNIDFHSFFPMANKHLDYVNNNIAKYLNLKFGNDVTKQNFNQNQSSSTANTINNLGFYKVFDRNNAIEDSTLFDYRINSDL